MSTYLGLLFGSMLTWSSCDTFRFIVSPLKPTKNAEYLTSIVSFIGEQHKAAKKVKQTYKKKNAAYPTRQQAARRIL